MDSTELAQVESETVHDFAQVMQVDDLLAPQSSAAQRQEWARSTGPDPDQAPARIAGAPSHPPGGGGFLE